MKRHAFYRWFRRVAMLSGIPVLTIFFTTCCKYGSRSPEVYMISGRVFDKETKEPISDIEIRYHENVYSITHENGSFELFESGCTDVYFSKEGYQSKDTTLCANVNNQVFLEKTSEE